MSRRIRPRIIVVAALLLAAACDRPARRVPEAPSLRVPMVDTWIDLLQRVPPVHVSGVHPPRRAFAILRDDIREALIVWLPTTVRFDNVPLHPDATFRFAVGAEPVVGTATQPVTFIVRLQADGRSTEIFRRTLEPTAGHFGSWLEAEVPLHNAAAGATRAHLELEALGGEPLVRAAWAWPEVVSAGTAAAGDRRRVVAVHYLRDLLAELDTAHLTPGPAGPVRRLQPGSPAQLPARASAIVPPGATARWKHPFVRGLQLTFTYAVVRSPDSAPAAGRVGFVLRARPAATGGEGTTWHTFAERFVDLATLEPGWSGLRTLSETVDVHLEAAVERDIEIELAGTGSNPPPHVRAAMASLVLSQHVDTPRVRQDGPGKNIVLLVVDSLRADRLGLYGETRPTSPRLDAVAAGGIVFDDVRATCPSTIPSTSALLTGRYLRRQGPYGTGGRLALDRVTLAEAAQRSGWTTAAFVANSLLGPGSGFEQGFEQYFDVAFRPARDVSRRVAEWIREHRDERFLLFVHYLDPHAPYSAPDPWYELFSPDYVGSVVRDTWAGALHHTRALLLTRAMLRGSPIDPSPALGEGIRGVGRRIEVGTALLDRLQALYLAEIRYWDDHLRLVLEALDAAGIRDRTILAVTADHGEEFAEDRHLGHGSGIHESVLRVPLVVSGPVPGAPRRIARPVSLIDVAPMLLDLAGIPVPTEMEGRTLPEIEKGPPTVVFSVNLSYVRSEPGADVTPQIAVRARTSEHDVVHLVRDDLWLAPAPPGSASPWRRLHPEAVPADLRRAVLAFELDLPGAHADNLPAGPEAAREPGLGLGDAGDRRLEALRALGYVE